MNAVIIGAGAAGLAAAVRLKQNMPFANVTVLERLSVAGKKILATGNGRCNITNTNAQGYEKCRDFFSSIGVALREEEEGRVYPYSLKAETVLSSLLDACENLGVQIICDCKVNRISENLEAFTVKGVFKADRLIVAAGGKAQSALGSDGSGYTLLKSLGHTVTPFSPALVQLTSSSKYPRMIKGTRTKCTLKIKIDGQEVCSEYGEVLFTDYGLSGIAAMNVSHEVSRNFQKKQPSKCLAVIDLAPDFSEKEILEHIEKFGSVKGILGTKLAEIIEKQASGDMQKQAKTIKNWRLILTGTKGYEYAQITSGGIPVDEIDNYESKIIKGLYICGEILDKQFPCGGFNLDFAWSSGIAAADNIAKEYGYDKN